MILFLVNFHSPTYHFYSSCSSYWVCTSRSSLHHLLHCWASLCVARSARRKVGGPSAKAGTRKLKCATIPLKPGFHSGWGTSLVGALQATPSPRPSMEGMLEPAKERLGMEGLVKPPIGKTWYHPVSRVLPTPTCHQPYPSLPSTPSPPQPPCLPQLSFFWSLPLVSLHASLESTSISFKLNWCFKLCLLPKDFTWVLWSCKNLPTHPPIKR